MMSLTRGMDLNLVKLCCGELASKELSGIETVSLTQLLEPHQFT